MRLWSIVMTFMVGLGLFDTVPHVLLLWLPLATSNFRQIRGHQLYSIQRNTPFATLEGDSAANVQLHTDLDQDLWPGY